MFIGRENELFDLNAMYAEDKFHLFVLYGRRRVGKTTLINEFCKDKPTIFLSALNTSSQENLEALSKAIYEKNYPGRNSYLYPPFHLVQNHSYYKIELQKQSQASLSLLE